MSNSELNFPYAGYVYDSSLNTVRSISYYWSRTASSSDNAYLLVFNNSTVSPANSYSRYVGFSIRCVATT